MRKINLLLIINFLFFFTFSSAFANQVLDLKRLTGEKDYSGKNNVIDVKENSSSARIPDLNKKTISIKLENGIPRYGLSVSFKFIPDNLNQSATIFSSEFLNISQNKNSIISAFSHPYSKSSNIVSNGVINTNSCNHFVATLDQRNHKIYLNSQMQSSNVNILGGITPNDKTIKFGQFPGRVWDIKFYDHVLTEEEVNNLSQKCTPDKVREPYDQKYPYPLCLVYVCLWADEKTDLSLDKFQYYVYSQERAFIHNIFEVGMYPHGKLDEYVIDGNLGIRNLTMSEGIVKTFVNPYSFSNPLTYENGNYWGHENFHSYQGNLIKFNGYGGGKWLLESNAEWGADAYFPGAHSSLLGFYSLNPHQTMWVMQNSSDSNMAGYQFTGGHMYGAGIFQTYLTNYVVDKSFIGEVFNRRENNAVERFYKILAEKNIDMKEVFSDFAARTVTWDYKNGENYKKLELAGLSRMKNAKKGLVRYDNRIAAEFDERGTNGSWKSPPAGFSPGSWAYNVYKMEVKNNDYNYKIEFKGNALNPGYSDFRVRVVVYRKGAREIYNLRQYHKMIIEKEVVFANKIASLNVEAQAGDEVYLIVATTPTDFTTPVTTKYQYSYKIIPNRIKSGSALDKTFDAAKRSSDYKMLNLLRKSPLKVFVLAGQSNMVGHGYVEEKNFKLDQQNGTLPWLLKNYKYQNRFKHLIDSKGNYVVRKDVNCYFEREGKTNYLGGLSVGCGAHDLSSEVTIGPELGFGTVIGNAIEEPVLLVKTAWGGKSLAVDFRPPSSGGTAGPYYKKMIKTVDKVLGNIKTYYPGYIGNGVELAGFVWFQGWNDMTNKDRLDEYEVNLKNLVTDVRRHFNAPKLPFVIIETGNAENDKLSAAQKAISIDPKFANVSFVPTREFIRSDFSPFKKYKYHWFGSFYSYYMIGEAAGKEMLNIYHK